VQRKAKRAGELILRHFETRPDRLHVNPSRYGNPVHAPLPTSSSREREGILKP
jgi:hypothetical protein